MTFRAGQARTKIQVQLRTVNTDEYGDHNESWATVHQPWAEIREIKFSDKLQSDSEVSSGEYIIQFRGCSEIGTVRPNENRIVDYPSGVIVFDILEAKAETDRYINWICKARIAL